jgi:hypothetical protein
MVEGFAAIPTHRQPPSWDGCRTIATSYDVLTLAQLVALRHELQVLELDRELAELGGDPLRNDWRDFRPLSGGREGAWSDWLAHLLLGGDTEFIRLLFRISDLPIVERPTVCREPECVIDHTDRTQRWYSSDIIVEWMGRPCGFTSK